MMNHDLYSGRTGKVASSAQGGVVLLSVLGLLLLLSLLASDAATQLSWNIQISRHWIQATGHRITQHQWVVELYRLDPSLLVAGTDSVDCDALADACIYFSGELSSGDTWHFVAEPSGAQDAGASITGRENPDRISGWLRRRVEEPTKVAAVWIEG